MKLIATIVALFAVALLASGCAGPASRHEDRNERQVGGHSYDGFYGVVDAIDIGRASNRGDAIAGALVGGIVGGVVGHQIGAGRGNDVATVAGALGGAVAGHEIAAAGAQAEVYFIRVRFDDGGIRTVQQSSLDGLRVGDGVRIEHDRVRRY